MTIKIPDCLIKFSSDCKEKVSDYIVSPSLFLGKKIVHFMSPRERNKDENKITYCAKETLVIVAKGIAVVASGILVADALRFGLYLGGAAVVYGVARYAQMDSNLGKIGDIIIVAKSIFKSAKESINKVSLFDKNDTDVDPIFGEMDIVEDCGTEEKRDTQDI